MKYARAHTHNRVRREKGEPYTGDIHTARRLYHKGVLEPDGSPNDHLITSTQPTQRWSDSTHESQPTPEPPASGLVDAHGNPLNPTRKGEDITWSE